MLYPNQVPYVGVYASVITSGLKFFVLNYHQGVIFEIKRPLKMVYMNIILNSDTRNVLQQSCEYHFSLIALSIN